MSKKKFNGLRHGEIMLLPVSDIPEGKTTLQDSYVIGHSETGHHHVIKSEKTFEITETDKHELYIRLFEPARIVHKKSVEPHRTLTIPAGIYKRFHDTEYDPYEKVIRNSED